MRTARRGFTLIELLVVMAVLAVLAAGVITAINPGKRLRQANDTKIRNDIGQIATALQAFYTTNTGSYPTATSDLVTSGDLKQVPTPPSGSGTSYTYSRTPGTCAPGGATPCTEVVVYASLQDPVTASNVWCWRSATGQASETTTTACAP